MSIHRFFASAPRGVEEVLSTELAALGAQSIVQSHGGVSFEGSLEIGCLSCLWSRTASRILLEVSAFDAPDERALYDGVQSFDWRKVLSPSGTIAVDFTAKNAPQFANSHFGALRVKDAIVDRFRLETGLRPSVDLERPSVRASVHVSGSHAVLSLDMSGESLHRRGYRKTSTLAPLKENLAAAILLMAGWPEVFAKGGALLDPMCGSGTFLVEAALMALGTAPGLLHAPFGFTRWKGFDLSAWEKMLADARARDGRMSAGFGKLPIFGADMDVSAVAAARANANRAGLKCAVTIDQRELSFTERPSGFSSGLLVANPPYGERLGEVRALARLYRRLGDVLKQRFDGWTGVILAGNLELSKEVGLRSSRRRELFNGAIECRLLEFPVRQGAFAKASSEKEKEQSETAAGAPSDAAASSASAASAQTAPRSLSEGAQGFANRLEKNFRHLSKWASRTGVSCYRVYDADLPDYALAIDLYEKWVHVQEYAPPKTIDPVRAERRLQEALAAIPRVLNVLPSDIHLKVRSRQRGLSQYGKFGDEGTLYEVHEGGLKFLVNLSDYLDTGLFLDHRPMRRLLGERAAGKRFLNLFGYTGTATVHAAAGGALSTVTADLSNTYLEWARRNMRLNGIGSLGEVSSPRSGKSPGSGDVRHEFIRCDVLSWLKGARGTFDLIFVDPPTFSASKSMAGTFDVQRDHAGLLRAALRLLSPGGELYFSTNLRRFSFDADGLSDYSPENISQKTIDPDFQRQSRIHQCWRLTAANR